MRYIFNPKKRSNYVDHQPERVDWTESRKMYWRLKGTLTDREVYLMAEGALQDSLETTRKTGELAGVRPTTHGAYTLRASAPEELLSMMSANEIVVCAEVLDILDEHYVDEMTSMERFYHAIQYIKWQRWLVYSFKTDFSDFQKSDLALESQFHKNQTDFYNRLHELRREKKVIEESIIDFVVEAIPESEAVVKKVKYVEQAEVVEAGAAKGPVGKN